MSMLWFVIAFLSAFFSGTQSFVLKNTMRKVSPLVVTWALSTFALPFSIIAVFLTGVPEIGPLFFPALVVEVITLLVSLVFYTKAIQVSDLSLSMPMLAFTPIFLLVTGFVFLGEVPSFYAFVGIAGVVFGAYVLSIHNLKRGLSAPLKALVEGEGTRLMLLVALLWSLSASFSKIVVIESTPFFAMFSIQVLSAFLMTSLLLWRGELNVEKVSSNLGALASLGLMSFLIDACVFFAFQLTLAVYVVAVKRFSILISSLYGFIFLKEKDMLQRLTGSVFMVAGAVVLLFATAT